MKQENKEFLEICLFTLLKQMEHTEIKLIILLAQGSQNGTGRCGQLATAKSPLPSHQCQVTAGQLHTAYSPWGQLAAGGLGLRVSVVMVSVRIGCSWLLLLPITHPAYHHHHQTAQNSMWWQQQCVCVCLKMGNTCCIATLHSAHSLTCPPSSPFECP